MNPLSISEIVNTPRITYFCLNNSFPAVIDPEVKTVSWFLKIGVKTKPSAKKTLIGKTKLIKPGENRTSANSMFSAEILPTSACERKILNLESKTNPKRTRETQQMFTIISLLI